ncbi:MAG TPA: hypothetical protein VN822_09195 [Candidatus Acidoferrales bacterium]|nr:hypothetical protein [Candidatus Acidoferrales bacterium]
MKKAISTLGLLAVLFATIGLSTIADQKTATWTGWISDDHCGAKGMSADHKACATTCIKNGSKYVFVNGADKKVIAIKNQDAVSGEKNLGQEVKVTGHLLNDGSLQVDSIANSKM